MSGRSSKSKRRAKLRKRQKREEKIKDISTAVEEVFAETVEDLVDMPEISTPEEGFMV